MKHYLVTWEIDVEVPGPAAAAAEAFALMQGPDTTATVFTVRDAAAGKSYRVELDPAGGAAEVRELDTGDTDRRVS